MADRDRSIAEARLTVADRLRTGRLLPMAEGHRLIAPARRTVEAHPLTVPHRRMVVADRIEEAEVERLLITVVVAGRRTAEVVVTAVAAVGDVPLPAAATVVIAN